MQKYFRLLLVIALVGGIALLAKGRIAWAGGAWRAADQSALARLSGFVWNDVNRNGLQDAGEPGIPRVVVNLYDQAKTLVNTVLTDTSGHYQFEGLAPGDYYVDFVPPTDFVVSLKDQGQDEARDSDVDAITGETLPATLVAGDNTLKWDLGLYQWNTPVADTRPGTVKPPPPEMTICEDGTGTVGGISILQVSHLAPDYCLTAFLRTNGFALGRLPKDAGTIVAPITFLRVFHLSDFVYELPDSDGTVRICYSSLSDKETLQIYFYDFYGPRFGKSGGQPSWQPLETTVDNGMACASAETSGAYALVGK